MSIGHQPLEMVGWSCYNVTGLDRIFFCHLLHTSMQHKQRIITREVGHSSDSESYFIIAAYRLQMKLAQVGDQLKEADTVKQWHGLCLQIKKQFLHLTFFFHSVSEINRRHFSAARQPRALHCDLGTAQVSLSSRCSSQL